MTSEDFSEQEQFEQGLYMMLRTIRILSLEAAEQCSEAGNFNTGWELKREGILFATMALGYSHGRIREAEGGLILAIVDALEALPPEAIVAPGLSPRTAEGCLAAMCHPAWAPIRDQAAAALQALSRASGWNEAYFSGN